MFLREKIAPLRILDPFIKSIAHLIDFQQVHVLFYLG